MSNQLIKETALGREQVFPKNYILNLKDKDSGANLEDILKSFNMLFLSYLGNKPDTRKQVPKSLRHGGLWITYIVNSTVVVEWYDNTATDDYTWGSDYYWREGSNMLVGDISISKQGTWVINGEDTGISPKGDKGDSPVIRIYNNRILVSYDGGNTYTDLNNTPVFTLFRFNSNTNTYLISYDLGLTWLNILPDKVYYKFRYNLSTNTYLVSTDLGKTWSNVSAEKVFYKFRFNPNTNTHQVSTDLGNNWVDISAEKVFYKFRTNENKLQVSTDLGTTWEDCSELIAAWFRWASGDTANSIGKILISRNELKTWTDLSPEITNNLYIKGYVATVGELPTSTAALGDIYMVGPTYDESDASHDYPHYRMWVKLSGGWVDNGEYLSNVLISLTTGLETGITMSLKAITNTIVEETARAKAAEEAIIYDVSAHNNGAVFESLSGLLSNSDLSTLIPTSVRHGGMTIRFIQGSEQGSDNKYVQARLMADSFTTDIAQWQGVDDEPTAGSNNLVKSGGTVSFVNTKVQDIIGFDKYKEYNYVIGSTLKWGYGSHILIMVNPYDVVKCVANDSTPTILAFLTSSEVGSYDSLAPVVSGTTRIMVDSGAKIEDIVVPEGTKYLYLTKSASNLNYLPSELYINGIDYAKSINEKYYNLRRDVETDSPEEIYVRTLEGLKSLNILNYMVTGALKWGYGSHILVNVNHGDIIYVTANNSASTVITCLTSDNIGKYDSDVPVVPGTSRFVFGTGSTNTFTVPAGTKYLCFTKTVQSTGDLDYLPAVLIVNGINITKDIRIRVSDLEKDIINVLPSISNIKDEEGWIDPSSFAYLGNGGTHKVIDVRKYKKLFIRANDDFTTIFFILNNQDYPSFNTPLSPAIGETKRRIYNKMTSIIIDLPSDATYIVIASMLHGDSYLPKEIYFDWFNYTDSHTITKPVEIENVNRNEGYRLIFEDDFDSFDNTLWADVNFAGVTYENVFKGDEETRYVENSVLKIKCVPTETPIDNKYYKGAYLSTSNNFAVHDGKIEAKMRFSTNAGNGFQPAFWCFSQSADWSDDWELDIMETYDADTVGTVHFPKNGVDSGFIFSKISKFDITEWHVYSLEWDENYVVNRIDGKIVGFVEIKSLNASARLNAPMDIRFNIKKSMESTEESATLEVDYVRVYSKFGDFPVRGLFHKDITMNVGESVYIKPKFTPLIPTNMAFSMNSSNNDIVECHEFKGNIENNLVEHRLDAIAEGTSIITLTTPEGIRNTFNVIVI